MKVDASYWSRQYQCFQPYEVGFQRDVEEAPGTRALLRGACEVLAGLGATGEVGRESETDVLAVALLILAGPRVYSYDGRGFEPGVLEAFLAACAREGGPARALRVLLGSADWELERRPAATLEYTPGQDPKATYCAGLTVVLRPAGAYRRFRDVRPWQALRAVLADADPVAYQAARDEAARRRCQLQVPGDRSRWDDSVGAVLVERVLLSHVFADEQEWSREDLGLALQVPNWQWVQGAAPLVASLRDADGVLALVDHLVALAGASPHLVEHAGAMARNLGLDAVPALVKMLAASHCKEHSQALVSALARIEGPAVAHAMAGLLDQRDCRPVAARYLVEHPALALPALLPWHVAGHGDLSTTLLARICGRFPEVARAVRSTLEEGPGEALDAFLGDVEEAGREEWPRVLADPPWARGAAARRQPEVLSLDVHPGEVHESWLPGEREAAMGQSHRNWLLAWHGQQGTLPAEADFLLDGTPLSLGRLFLVADPEAAARVLQAAPLTAWEPPHPGKSLLPFAALLGKAFLPLLLHWAPKHLAECASSLLHFDAPEVAPHLAVVLSRFRQIRVGDAPGQPRVAMARPLVHRWLLERARTASLGLIPVAVGPGGEGRQAAEEALRFLAASGQGDVVRGVARELGAERAVDEVLAFDALLDFREARPRPPAFFEPAGLPRPRLAANGRALPCEAVRHLGSMLAFSPLFPPYAGIAQVKEACSEASLDAFAWALFQAWLLEGAPPREQWCLTALGLLGSDEIAARLVPYLRTWPREGAQARAVVGLDVLALIGSDAAIRCLCSLAEHGKKALAQKGRERLDEVARMRSLSAEELVDRLVPDFGLDDDGTCLLDFGSRRFRVGFDAQWAPFVVQESAEGAATPLKDLPPAGEGDDRELAAQALEQWRLLKKGVKRVLGEQVQRLEMALCTERRWQVREFRDTLLRHPLLVNVVRRFVWGVFNQEGNLVESFRVCEDNTLADARDERTVLPAVGRVGLVHPLHLSAEGLASWRGVFSDYRIVQPFPQLGRVVRLMTDGERQASTLDRVDGRRTATARLLGLERRGWRKGPTVRRRHSLEQVVVVYEKPLAEGALLALLPFEPGFDLGSNEGTQQLGPVRFLFTSGRQAWEGGSSLETLSPVAFSELVMDLETLKAVK